MADQFFVAFSKDMLGVGIFAGGPYGCADGSLSSALGRCMNPAFYDQIDSSVIQDLYEKAIDYADQGKIDAVEYIEGKKVYIFSGTQDMTVRPEVTDWVDDWYLLAGIPSENIVYKDDLDAPHTLPTLDYGNFCPTPGNPWMNDCDYDGAGQALSHILGALNPPQITSQLSGRFVKFDQNEFFDPENLTAEELKSRFSMNEYGFAYIPQACSDGDPCRAHVVFHGCKQVYNRNPDASDFSPDDASNPFGLQFVKYAGYNEWADTNNLIILYPQAQKLQSSNPRGCYDWWGYLAGTTDTYATKQGPQMKAVYAMLERVAGGPPPMCEGTNQQPVITLAGADRIEIDTGASLVLPDPEATALDPEDGDISDDIIREPAGAVETDLPGTYLLIYNVSDSEGCAAREVIRTIIVGGCEQWTATNAEHAAANRAESGTCYWFFFPYTCYHAVGSGDSLGTASTTTTLRQERADEMVYELGACP
jgi:poly(3-hydroxybutyrate) depolymerase